DTNGHVAEGSVEHIFLVRHAALVTPPLTYLLEGITRDAVIRLALEQGIEVREELFSRDYILTSDEVFFAGTGAEVTPVVEVGNGGMGRGGGVLVPAKIKKVFLDVVYGRTNRGGECPTRVGEKEPPCQQCLPMNTPIASSGRERSCASARSMRSSSRTPC